MENKKSLFLKIFTHFDRDVNRFTLVPRRGETMKERGRKCIT